MNKDEARRIIERIDVIRAYADGEAIQFKVDGIPNWKTFNSDEANIFGSDVKWRIKPKPVEGWTVGHEGYFGSMKDSEEDADRFLAELKADNPKSMYENWWVFKVREVE